MAGVRSPDTLPVFDPTTPAIGLAASAILAVSSAIMKVAAVASSGHDGLAASQTRCESCASTKPMKC